MRARDLGCVYGAETGFLLARAPDTVRASDVAFVRTGRVPPPGPGYFPGPPDLAVEVVSPTDSFAEVHEKALSWLTHGTRAVWLVEPMARTVAVLRGHGDVRVLTAESELRGGDLLPGFACPVAALFPRLPDSAEQSRTPPRGRTRRRNDVPLDAGADAGTAAAKVMSSSRSHEASMHPMPLLASILLLAGSASAQLAGVYLVNPLVPTGGGNYASLADAVADLNAQGVSAPVTFLLFDDAGPYTETSNFVAGNAGGTYGVPFNTAPSAVLVMGSWNGTSPNNRVTFEPAAGEHVVFDATGKSCGVFWGGADYVTLRGIEIANAAYDGISFYAEASHGIAQDPIVDGCRIHDSGGPAITIYGNTPQPANTLVQNCTMWSCMKVGGGPFGTTGRFGYVTTRRTNGTRIVHNTFFVDTASGADACVIGAYPSGSAEVPYVEISNNIVVRTAAAANAPFFRIKSPATTSFPLPLLCDSNCFFELAPGNFAHWGTNGSTVEPTFASWQSSTSLDPQSLAVDPQLRDGPGRDFHLLPASPCIGTSQVAAGVATDLDGQARTTALDIGADEFSAATLDAVGTGCPGTSGLPPRLTSYDWPFLGNPDFAVIAEDVQPGLFVFLFGALGTSPVPIPIGGGCSVLLDPGSFVGLTANVASPGGTTSFSFNLPANPAFAGLTAGYQALVLDGGATLGFTLTNALGVTFDL